MDLSQLSDSDLQALNAGNLASVSDTGLKLLSDQQQPDAVADVAHSAISGLGRGLPNAVDYLASFPASLASQFTDNPASPSQMRQNGVNAAIDSAVGPQYQPQTKYGEYTKATTAGATGSLLAPELAVPGLLRGAATGAAGGYFGQAGGDLADNNLHDYLGDYARPVGTLIGGGVGGATTASTLNAVAPKGPTIPVAEDAQTSAMNAAGVVRGQAQAADANVQDLYKQAQQTGVGIRGPLVQGQLLPALENDPAMQAYKAARRSDFGLLQSTQDVASTNGNIPLLNLEALRKASVQGQSSQDAFEAPASTAFKRQYDNFLDNIPDDYLTEAQQGGIQAFQDARAARAQYGQTFEQGLNGERTGLDKVVSQPNMTGADVMNKVLSGPSAAQTSQDMIAAAGDQGYQVQNSLRQALIQKLQAGATKNGAVDPVAFRNQVGQLMNRNPELAKTLLTQDDIQQLSGLGSQSLLSKVADKATGLTGEAAGAILGHHLGGEPGAAAGVAAAGLLRIPLRAAQGSSIDSTLGGLLSRPYGVAAPAMASKGILGLQGATASTGTLGGLLAPPQQPQAAPSPASVTPPADNLPYVNSPVSPQDRDAAIRTMYGEARGESPQGQAAVASVILNRLKAGNYGGSVTDVVTAKNQFEPWNNPKTKAQLQALDPSSPAYQQLGQIFDQVAGGQIPDPTNGATHFLAPTVQKAKGRSIPAWAKNPVAQIGGHTFYNPNAMQMAGM